MFKKMSPPCWPCTVVLLLLTFCVPGFTQDYEKADPGKTAEDGALTTQLVKTGLYVISGGGCNSLLRLSGNGLILVDGKLPGNYAGLLKQVRRISDQPVRALIVTDYHQAHTGNNAKFIEAGTGIIAQENVKNSLTTYDPPGGKIAAPTLTYDREYRLKL